LAQSFETSDPLEARADWNNLQVRLTHPQNITLANALAIEKIFVAGTNTNLKAGDTLLFAFDDSGDPSVLRNVQSIEGQFEQKRTLIQLQEVAPAVAAAVPVLVDFVTKAKKLVTAATSGAGQSLVNTAAEILINTCLGMESSPKGWSELIQDATDGLPVPEPDIESVFQAFDAGLKEVLGESPSPASGVVFTDPSKFVTPLLLAQKVQAASSFRLTRSLGAAFKPGSDSTPQLLVNFAPRLKASFYTAWATANVNQTTPTLKGVFALRVEASLFGASVPRPPKYDGDKHILQPYQWDDWPSLDREIPDGVFLSQAYDAIEPASYVVIQQSSGSDITRTVKQLKAVQTVQRTAYGVSGQSTRLEFPPSETPWNLKNMEDLRGTLVRAQSEPLTLVEEPLTSDVQGQEIPLNKLFNELTSGRWVIVTGERTDIPGVIGVKASELLMISSLRQDFDATLPGDKTRTTLLLATPTAYSYKRDTVTIDGNVVKATHGETRNETLGNGDGSQSLQSFTLKQPPLTFVPAPNPTGVDSTLEVFVNDVQWHESDALAGLGPKDRKFITKTDDAGKTSVIFGNGEQGARLPTGMANVTSIYRNGIGKPGNVKAEQISLLQTRPLGVKSVINPRPASGGADKENRDQARDNAPLAVTSLDRLVSVQDYADFTRTFAGIGKPAARKLSDAKRQLVHVTIAGADDIPIDATSDLYQNLLIALRKFGDPDLPVQVQLRELVVLVLSANVRLAADYQWEPVATEIRATLLDVFGFQKRALGQPVLLSETISTIQNTAGVEYVDVDAFGGIPEMKAGTDGSRRLLTLDEMSIAAMEIAVPASTVWFFAAEDFLDLKSLVESLTNQGSNVSKFLWNQFSSDDQNLLKESQAKTSMPATVVAALITEFNRVLLGPSIYDASRFDQAQISLEIQNMIQQNPQGSALVHLNRLLLEAAYPNNIKPSKTKPTPSLGIPKTVPVNLADFESGALRPAQLAIFTDAVPDTLILNQIK
jgi:predicted phage baseplate assembly protein